MKASESELTKLAHEFVEKIRRDYPQDISIVAIYGSYVYDELTEFSDLDLFFIPKTQRGYKMTQAFIYKDIGMDFWPISWERAESMANYEDMVSLIAEAEVIYYGDESDKERFQNLKKRIIHGLSREDFVHKAKESVRQACDVYFEMLDDKEDFHRVKVLSVGVMKHLAQALVLNDNTYVKRGGEKFIRQAGATKKTPDEFTGVCRELAESKDSESIISYCQNLISSVRRTIFAETAKGHEDRDYYDGFYEELKSTYNKIHSACEENNCMSALLAMESIEMETENYLGRESKEKLRLPDLAEALDVQDFSILATAAREHENLLVDFLDANNVPVARVDSVEGFRRLLESK
ncbi:MAG TPA: nucleotidyltransferase domain-containing protein [Clostridiaceae bacterium]|nr:nucleotidyltransferase domain-containing protein [Clostridiaceae bacterium]